MTLKVVNKKLVVTGASGFIGDAFCQVLANSPGLTVVPVSRKSNRSEFVFSKGYCDLPKGDICVHFGEDSDRARVNKSGQKYRLESGKVIDSILNNGFDYVLYASSAAVYGDSGNLPYTEDDFTYGGDEYSAIKLQNEAKILEAGGAVVRLTNIVGPGMAKNNVLSDIIKQLPEPGPLIVRNGRPIKDFISLADVADAITHLVGMKATGLYNVGAGEGRSINDLARLCLEVYGQRDRKVISISKSSINSYNVVDIRKIKDFSAWQPSTQLADLIKSLLCEDLGGSRSL